MTDKQKIKTDGEQGWNRIWCPIEAPSVSESNEGEMELSDARADCVSLSDLSSTPCLVLVAEAGMGKTWEVTMLAEQLGADNEMVDLIQGRDPDLPSTLKTLLTSSHHQDWVELKRPWHIIIDGVDEFSSASRPAEALLGSFFDSLIAVGSGFELLRIIITSRAAAWTKALDQVIADRWPKDAFIPHRYESDTRKRGGQLPGLSRFR